MNDANLTPCDRLDYTYDGLTMIYGLNNPATASLTANLYVWGRDLSGSLQGAGGIGGLLTAQLNNPTTSNSTTVLYTYCANGNVSELVDTTGTNILAHYEYSPFGKVIVATGPLAEVNPYGFSTRYFDIETGIGKWPHRDYLPGVGRWASRDPMGEEGGPDLYAFVGNSVLLKVDPTGLISVSFVGYDSSGNRRKDGKDLASHRDIDPTKVPKGKLQSWGEFYAEPFLENDGGCCRVEYQVCIYTRSEYVDPVSGVTVTLRRHQVIATRPTKSGFSARGTIGVSPDGYSPMPTAVLLHEMGHARAWFDMVKPVVTKQMEALPESTCNDMTKGQATVDQIDENAQTVAYWYRSAALAFSMEVGWYESSPQWKNTTSGYLMVDPDPDSVSFVYEP